MAGSRGGAPVRVGDLLTTAVPALAERQLEDRIRNQWAATVGPELARRSRPATLRAGTLEVVVDNSPWLQELTLRADALLAACRSRWGGAVTGLRFTLGQIREAAPAPARPPSPSPPRSLTAAESRAVAAAVAEVRDPALAASLGRLIGKDLVARRAPRSVP